jgi:hypothetical protein
MIEKMKNIDDYNQKEIELVRDNTFPHDILLIDGQGRSGKNMISVILSTMPRVENMRIDTLLDYVPRYYYLNKMSHDAAVASLKIEMDEKLYNAMISRSVNFRFEDYSSVYKGGKRFLYIKRLFQKAENHAVERMNKEKPIFQNMTHDGLHLIDLYFSAFGDRLKFIHVFRDPVANIYEQGIRGFGERIGIDPREFQLAYKYGNETIPLNAIGMEEDYLKGNPTERLVIMVDKLLRRNIQGYIDLDNKWKKNVFLTEFEKFAIDPWPYIERLEKFLGTHRVSRTKKIMKRERCPRKPNVDQRESRIKSIEKVLSPKYLNIFKGLVTYYDTRPWERF